jgi:hypothetical protein
MGKTKVALILPIPKFSDCSCTWVEAISLSRDLVLVIELDGNEHDDANKRLRGSYGYWLAIAGARAQFFVLT